MEQQWCTACFLHIDNAPGQQQVIADRPLRVAGAGEVDRGTGDTRWRVFAVVQQGHIGESMAHLRIGEPARQGFLASAEHADRKAGGALERGQALRMQGEVPQPSGGCSEIGTNELMVSPCGFPCASRAQTIATPVGKWPSNRRSARGGSLTDGTGAGAGNTPAHGPAYAPESAFMRPWPGGSAGRPRPS